MMQDLSVAEIAALAAGGVLLIGAFFAGVVSVIQAWRSMVGKIDNVAKDAAVVLGHVNSEKSIAEGRENTLKRENTLLREMLDERKQAAALLAQSASAPTVTVALPAAVPKVEP